MKRAAFVSEVRRGMAVSSVVLSMIALTVVGCSGPPIPPPGRYPQLVEEGFHSDFNIVQYGGKYYALAQDEGPFDIEKVQKKAYRRCYEGASIDEVKKLVLSTPAATSADHSAPRLVEEGFMTEFNIIAYRGKYYALAQDEGPFDIEKVQKKAYRRFYEGQSIDEVKKLVPPDSFGTRMKKRLKRLVPGRA